MCGRYVSATPPDQLARFFDATSLVGMPGNPDERYVGNYNVAPTQGVLAVYESSGERLLDRFHWGLVPFWAKDPSVGSKMINARAETLAEKNSFKRPFATKRCIIPADGFYEWKNIEGHKRKQPMFLTTIDGSPFAFAGLWEVWSNGQELDDTGEPLQLFSCTIVTCEPNDAIADVHDRMPV
ncbi:MAG: SOS response-associated peptidase, partial [Actinomycetota bacterium]|nr:SOS response-associated peptidase [Actinomycetota bacterium]